MRTGGEVDLSHQEILWLQLGEAIVAADSGPDVERLGNAIPGAATSGVFPARDERWIAVVSDVPCEDCLAESVERTVEELVARLEERGARATEVLHVAEARSDDAMAAAIERVDHPVTQDIPYLRVPLRVDDEPVDTRSAAPLFDANTREVLAEWLELTEGEIDALEAGGAVGGAPDPEALRAFYRNVSRGAKR